MPKIREKRAVTRSSGVAPNSWNRITSVSKFNKLIADEEKQLDACYRQIGERYYSFFFDRPGEQFEGLCLSISASKKRIGEHQNAILHLKGVKRCVQCGAELADGTVFCGLCGFDTMAGGRTEYQNKCINCNADILEGNIYCTHCGQKLQEIIG